MLSSNLVKLDRAEVLGQRPERTTSIDLRKLLVIADQHQLGLDLRGMAGEAIDGARANHPRLIDHQHRAPNKTMSLLDVDQHPSDRGAIDAGKILEL